MNKVAVLIVLATIIAMFSLLTIGELWLLCWMGLDIVGHIKATYSSGNGIQLFIEAFGAIAFVIGQPIVLFGALITAYQKIAPTLQKIAPDIASKLSDVTSSLLRL